MTDHSADGPRIQDGEVYDQLSSILGRPADFEEQSAEALRLGKKFLGVDNGHITRVEPTVGYWETIGSSGPSDDDFPVGLMLDFDDTYCRKTVAAGSTIALDNAPEQGWADDPAYQKHELKTYVGTPFEIDGKSYGTVCFVSSEAHPRPFRASEISFVEFLAEFVGQTIEHKRKEEIIAEKERIISILSRVLRHNVSNNLNVVHGHAKLLDDRVDDALGEHVDAIKTNSENLMRLAEKARKLQSIVNADHDRSSVELETLVSETTSTVRQSFPETQFSVDCPSGVTVQLLPFLETALVELLENAAKHTDEAPTVEVTVTRSQRTFSIRIEDNGPGLPDMERQVLQGGEELPLAHGSGLGLWMVHWIVSRHDGTITTTCADSGTEIAVTIPYATAKIPSDIEPDS